jgi:hypothetical protein
MLNFSKPLTRKVDCKRRLLLRSTYLLGSGFNVFTAVAMKTRSLLECCALSTGTNLPLFRMKLLHSSSGSSSQRRFIPPKSRQTFTIRHGIAPQNTNFHIYFEFDEITSFNSQNSFFFLKFIQQLPTSSPSSFRHIYPSLYIFFNNVF